MCQYQITLYGKTLGNPMPRNEAEEKLGRLKDVVKGLEMRRVKCS